MRRRIDKLKLKEIARYVHKQNVILNTLENNLPTDVIKYNILPFVVNPVETIDKWYNLFKSLLVKSDIVHFSSTVETTVAKKNYEEMKDIFRKSVIKIKTVEELNICIDMYNIMYTGLIRRYYRGILVHAQAPIYIVYNFFKNKGHTLHQITPSTLYFNV